MPCAVHHRHHRSKKKGTEFIFSPLPLCLLSISRTEGDCDTIHDDEFYVTEAHACRDGATLLFFVSDSIKALDLFWRESPHHMYIMHDVLLSTKRDCNDVSFYHGEEGGRHRQRIISKQEKLLFIHKRIDMLRASSLFFHSLTPFFWRENVQWWHPAAHVHQLT